MKASSNTPRRLSSSSAFKISRMKALRAFRRDRNQAFPHSITALLRRTSSSGQPKLIKSIKDTTTPSTNANTQASIFLKNSYSRNSEKPKVDSSHPTKADSNLRTSPSDHALSRAGTHNINRVTSMPAGYLQGRRTSGRQRKPSCRLTFDDSPNTNANDRIRHKVSLSRSSSCGSSCSGGDHHSSDPSKVSRNKNSNKTSSSVIASQSQISNKILVNRSEEISHRVINTDDNNLLPPPPVKIERCSVILQKNFEMPVLTRMSKGKLLAEKQVFGRADQLLLLNKDVSLCYCRKDEKVFAQREGDKNVSAAQKNNFCQATDLIDGTSIGCTRIGSSNLQLRRVSARGVFKLLCKYHEQRLQMHHCCPICDSFCTQGEDVIMCEAAQAKSINKRVGIENDSKVELKEYHFFHKSCSIQEIRNSFGEANNNNGAANNGDLFEVIWNKISCPHCGAKGRESLREVMLEMSGSRPPIYMDEKPQSLMDISVATFASDPEGSKAATIKFLTDSFSPAIQAACDKARSTHRKSLNPLNAKTAVEQRNLSEFIAYLAHDGDPFHIYDESNGESLAHIVVRSGDLSFLHVLYTCIEEHGKGDYFPLDIPDIDGLTPLMLGVQLNHMNMVKYLLACGANFHLKTSDGLTILHIAVKSGHTKMVETLLSFVDKKVLESRNNEGMTALGFAAKEGKSEIMNILTRLYSSLNLLNDLDNLLRRTPLHWAVVNAQVDSVVNLIKHGAQINAKDIDGNTPLHLAVLSESENSEGNALALLINRSDPFLENNEGHTVLDYCKDHSGKEFSSNVVQRKKKESILRIIESNESIKQLQLTDSPSNLRVLHRDIPKGKEKHSPIPCVGPISLQSQVNSALSNFTYITTFVSENPTLRPDLNITNTHRCSCDSQSCSTTSYNCCIRGDGLHYVNQKLVIPEGITEPGNLIVYECNDFCSCEVKSCSNRVVQKGLRQNLAVFVKDNHSNSGIGVTSFGVRTQRFIERGSFVCELVGELVLSSDINLRLKSHYYNNKCNSGDGKKAYEPNIFELYESEEKFKILVDFQRYGNICRFIQKSSSVAPNLIPVKVFVEHSDPRFPSICFFANRDILAGEELTYG